MTELLQGCHSAAEPCSPHNFTAYIPVLTLVTTFKSLSLSCPHQLVFHWWCSSFLPSAFDEDRIHLYMHECIYCKEIWKQFEMDLKAVWVVTHKYKAGLILNLKEIHICLCDFTDYPLPIVLLPHAVCNSSFTAEHVAAKDVCFYF